VNPDDIKALEVAPPLRPYVDDEDVTVTEGWTIQNKNSLDWAVGRIAAKKGDIESIESQANEAIRRIQAKRDSIISGINRGIAFLSAHVAKYANENRDTLIKGTGKKSLVLLHGTVGWRKRAGRLVVVDEQALGAWLREQDNLSLFRIKVEPEMKALQENYQKNGTIPPGMEYVVEQEKFYIEADAPETALKVTK
jgi:phage host-nuclease inhibitor protein Gam